MRKGGLQRKKGLGKRSGLKSPPTGLKRSGGLKRSAGPKRKVRVRPLNVARARKRQAAYAKYLKSPTWFAIRDQAMARAGWQCEYIGPNPFLRHATALYVQDEASSPMPPTMRCQVTGSSNLDGHHRRYSRKGLGHESPDWIQILCREHHNEAEAEHPTRQARRLALARAKP